MRIQRTLWVGLVFAGGVAAVSVCMLVSWRLPIPEDSRGTSNPASHTVYQGTTPRDVPDPANDGWESEVISNHAESQLKTIGKLLVAPANLTAVSLRQLVSENTSCSRLRPESLAMVFDQGGIRVERLVRGPAGSDNAQPAHRGPEEIAEALNLLSGPLHEAQARRAEFKVFHIEVAEDSRFTTRQYLSMSGRTPAGVTEINTTWKMEWFMPTGPSPPRIDHIETERFEQVTATRGGQPLFVDATRAVLGRNESFWRQLKYGHSHWGRMIEHHLHFYLFGHHGLAVGDVNGDGLDDVYRCQPGGIPNRLYVAQIDGSAKDASADAGVDFLDNTRSALILDMDNDGDQDMALVLFDELLLLENDGPGRFTVRAQFHPLHHGYSLAAADYDLDGDLDIYVCAYYPSGESGSDFPAPVPYYDANNGSPNHLFRNDGNWRFTDATDETGLDMNNRRFSYAAAWEDYDNDGDADLYVANDFGRNNLYRNDSGRFVDVAADVGLEDGAFGMSVTFGDCNRDGLMDVYVGNMFSAAGGRVTYQQRFKPEATGPMKEFFRRLTRGNTLFLNSPNGRFRDVSSEAGVTMGRWSWSSLFADLNNDGWEDLLVANGLITGEDTRDL